MTVRPRGRHRPRGRRRPAERGQATVELALALPVVLVGLLLVVQAALVVAGHVAAVHAAREGARAAAVDGRSGAAAEAVAATGPDGCTTTVHRPARVGATLRVTVRCRISTDVPLVGPLVPDVTVRTSAAMRVER